MAQAPAAFTRVASALLRYQNAFQSARAEAHAAIADAAAAEQATSLARSKHQQAVRDAALAEPGTPAATPPVYSDPGAVGLALAQTRLAAAQVTLLEVGNEVAAEIYAAAGSASNASPEITDDGWDAFWNSPLGRGPLLHLFPALDPTVSGFLKGFTSAAWDTIVGLSDLIQALDPTQRLLRDLRNFLTGGPDALFGQYLEDGQKLVAIGTDPLGALREIWRQVSAEDLWATNPAEATGRVTFEILSLVVPVAKVGTVSKLGKGGKAGTSLPGIVGVSAAQRKLIDELIGSGVKVSPEKVVMIMKTTDGRIVWLEEGTTSLMTAKPSGLAHIIERHGSEFVQRGISEAQIPEVLTKAIQDGRIVGYQGMGTGRPIYEFEYKGTTLKLAITIGDNGYIVGANFTK